MEVRPTTFTKGTVSLYIQYTMDQLRRPMDLEDDIPAYHLVRVVNEAVHRLDDQIFREAFTPKFLANMRGSGLSLDSFLCSKYRAFPVQLKQVEDQGALHYAPRENSERQHLRSFRDISQQHSEGWLLLDKPSLPIEL